MVNQGLNILVGRQDRFDWKGLAAAAIAAPIAAGIGNVVSGSAAFNGDGIEEVDPNKIDFAPRFAGGIAGGVAATVVRQAVYGGGRMNFTAVAADAFGNAVAQALLRSGVQGAQQQPEAQANWLAGQGGGLGLKLPAEATLAPGLENFRTVAPQVTDNGVRFTSQEVEGVADDADLSDRVFRDDGAGGLSEITAEDRDRDRLLGRISDQIYAQDQADVQQARLAAAARAESAQNQRELNRTASLVAANAPGVNPVTAGFPGSTFDLEFGSGTSGPAFADPAGGGRFIRDSGRLVYNGALSVADFALQVARGTLAPPRLADGTIDINALTTPILGGLRAEYETPGLNGVVGAVLEAGAGGFGLGLVSRGARLGAVDDIVTKGTAADRATQIHSVLDPRAQRARTTAVTETQEGVRVISSSERRLTPAQRAQLGANEVEGVGVGHAEVTGVNAARGMGLTPTGTAASRPICPSCAGTLREQGIDPLSPLK